MPSPFPILPARALLELGERIATARRARELTQADLAHLSGVGLSTLRSLESGHPGVSVGNMMKTLDALGLLGQVGDWLAPGKDPAVVEFARSKLEH